MPHRRSAVETNTGAGETPAARVERLVAAHRLRPGAFLSVLESLQHEEPAGYLAAEVVREAARQLDVPASQAYGVVTFYAFFNLKPQGRHTITICRGTACHTRASRTLLDAARGALRLGTPPDETETSQTTADHEFTVRTVACFGQCALAPVVAFDKTIHGHMNRQKLLGMLPPLRMKGPTQ